MYKFFRKNVTLNKGGLLCSKRLKDFWSKHTEKKITTDPIAHIVAIQILMGIIALFVGGPIKENFIKMNQAR